MPSPFIKKEFTFTNPDGSAIKVIGSGNQHYAVFETLDGYTVVKNPANGFYEYAERSSDGTRLLPSGVRAGDAKNLKLSGVRLLRIFAAARVRESVRRRRRFKSLQESRAGKFAVRRD